MPAEHGRGLDDDRVPSSQRRPGFMSHERDGIVEWQDARNDTQRLAHEVPDPFFAPGTGIKRETFPVQRPRHFGCHPEHLGSPPRFALGLRDGLGPFLRQQFGNFVCVGLDPVGRFVEYMHTLMDWKRVRSCFLGCGHGGTHVLRTGHRKGTDEFVVERIPNVKLFVRDNAIGSDDERGGHVSPYWWAGIGT